jgi:hypothetical protein
MRTMRGALPERGDASPGARPFGAWGDRAAIGLAHTLGVIGQAIVRVSPVVGYLPPSVSSRGVTAGILIRRAIAFFAVFLSLDFALRAVPGRPPSPPPSFIIFACIITAVVVTSFCRHINRDRGAVTFAGVTITFAAFRQFAVQFICMFHVYLVGSWSKGPVWSVLIAFFVAAMTSAPFARTTTRRFSSKVHS